MTEKIESFYVVAGRLIRDCRNRLGMTQEKLGELLSPRMTRVSIANIEAGKQRFYAHTLANLSEVLKTDIGNFLPKESPLVANVDATVEKELIAKLKISKSRAKALLGAKRKPKN